MEDTEYFPHTNVIMSRNVTVTILDNEVRFELIQFAKHRA